MNKIRLILLLHIVLFLSTTGCAFYSTAHNIKPTDDLGGNKILAGRLLFYDNDAPGVESSREFIMFFNKEGDKESTALEPDKEGFFYIPATVGTYNFAGVKVQNLVTGIFNFALPTFPSVKIEENDSAVNTGTFHIKFYQSTGAKASAVLVGLTRGSVKVEHEPNYEITRATIVTKIGTAMPLTDGKVTFLNRAQ